MQVSAPGVFVVGLILPDTVSGTQNNLSLAPGVSGETQLTTVGSLGLMVDPCTTTSTSVSAELSESRHAEALTGPHVDWSGPDPHVTNIIPQELEWTRCEGPGRAPLFTDAEPRGGI